jgi:hypothetical protein
VLTIVKGKRKNAAAYPGVVRQHSLRAENGLTPNKKGVTQRYEPLATPPLLALFPMKRPRT